MSILKKGSNLVQNATTPVMIYATEVHFGGKLSVFQQEAGLMNISQSLILSIKIYPTYGFVSPFTYNAWLNLDAIPCRPCFFHDKYLTFITIC